MPEMLHNDALEPSWDLLWVCWGCFFVDRRVAFCAFPSPLGRVFCRQACGFFVFRGSNTQNVRVFSRFLLPPVSPIRKMHDFVRVFCCSANGAWLVWRWGLPENVLRCTLFDDRRVAFFGKCSFCLSFWELLDVFVDRRFHA